jgi:hypothetical protein
MRRMKKEIGDYPMKPIEIVDAFEEYGWDSPRIPWSVVKGKLSRAYGISSTDTKLLARCKTAFNRGVREAKENKPGITAKAREYAKKQQSL